MTGRIAGVPFVGTLDPHGIAVPVLHLPNHPGLCGGTIHAGALTPDSTRATLFRHVSAPQAWTLRCGTGGEASAAANNDSVMPRTTAPVHCRP